MNMEYMNIEYTNTKYMNIEYINTEYMRAKHAKFYIHTDIMIPSTLSSYLFPPYLNRQTPTLRLEECFF